MRSSLWIYRGRKYPILKALGRSRAVDILEGISSGKTRFSELMFELRINSTAMHDTLGSLVAEGLILKTGPIRGITGYTLTAEGEEVLKIIKKWR